MVRARSAAQPSNPAPELLISVDVETAGPNPSRYSLLSIGACLVDQPDQTFYVELTPVGTLITAEAFAVGGISLEHAAVNGTEPAAAMGSFEEWIARVTPAGGSPVFVGFNAGFDWMFVCDYFERFLGRNPFGHSSLDVKSYYLGVAGGTWAETSMRRLSPRYLDGRSLSHNALGDAQDQAELFRAIRADAESLRPQHQNRSEA
jgi:DNA polymerase III epsilon subunit-like protein